MLPPMCVMIHLLKVIRNSSAWIKVQMGPYASDNSVGFIW